MLIVGEAGIGKTRLAPEAVAAAESTGGRCCRPAVTPRSVRCSCSRSSMRLPALAATMRLTAPGAGRGPRHGRVRRSLASGGELFGAPPSRNGPRPEVELRAPTRASRRCCGGLADGRTVLLVLDDLQNAGRATVDSCTTWPGTPGAARLLVVGTVRAEEGRGRSRRARRCRRPVDLGPLRRDAVAQLAAAAGRGELAEVILRRTRGHALFVTETLRGLAAGRPGIRSRCRRRCWRGCAGPDRRPRSCSGPAPCWAPRWTRRSWPAYWRCPRTSPRSGASRPPRAAARRRRSDLRVRQRPGAGGDLRHHARTDPTGVPPPGRGPAHRPAGVGGRHAAAVAGLAAGRAGLPAGRSTSRRPVRDQGRGEPC